MKRLQLLDYGRFCAALSVVAFHYLFNGIQNGKILSITHIPAAVDFAKYGYLGVEFFFMISGYVIFFSAKNRSASEFAVSRVIRLYPAFWAAVLFTSFFAYFWGGEKMSVQFMQVITNLTMVPALFGYGYVDGVYWTLRLELSFYLMVVLFLLIGWQKKLELVFLAWPFAILFFLIIGKSGFPYMGGYYSYFAAGCVFAILKYRPSKKYLPSLITCFFLCVWFAVSKASSLESVKGVEYSKLVIGTVISLQFLFFLFLNSKLGSNLKLPGSALAGGITYPLYLIHAHFGYMLISRFSTEEIKIPFYIFVTLLVLLISYLIHTYIEKKNAKTWKTLFSRTVGVAVEALNRRFSRFSPAYNSPGNPPN